MTGYGDELRRRRLRAGLTQRELAARAGISQPAVAAIEAGHRRVTDATRDAVETALRVPPSRLLEGAREELRALLAAHGVTEPRVFGSVARHEDSEGSDLDLLVKLPARFDVFDVAYLAQEIEVLLGVPVDVVPDEGPSPILDHARAEAVPL